MTLNLIFLDIELVVKTFEDITVFIMFFYRPNVQASCYGATPSSGIFNSG